MYRGRRYRISETMRDLVREHTLNVKDLIWPIFVIAGETAPIEAMPGVYRYTVDALLAAVEEAYGLGIRALLLFGIPARKDERGDAAADENGPVPTAIRAIKAKYPDMVCIADVCLCEYTTHGHCGLLPADTLKGVPTSSDGLQPVNDATLPQLAKAAVCYAKAGADIVAPSDMMDGRVAAIRTALDAAGFEYVSIMGYAAKFASGYYGPFRDAAGSAPQFGDRRSYQMDPANGQEALREVEADIEEGADFVIAKPAIAYLDVMKDIVDNFKVPVVAYNVSGEYSMVKAAAEKGWIDEKRVVMENMIGMKRAGARMIITYHAIDVAHWLAM